jgi:uncharacterized integral membrane protein
MRLLKIFIGTLALLGLLWILMQNTQKVSIDLLVRQFTDVPVAVVLIVTVAIGIFIGYLMALSVIVAAKAESRAFRSQNKKLTDEVNSVRNIAVDEGIYEVDDEEE